jgi:hypothetical protein
MERRRGAPRKRTLTRAKIVCADRRPTIDCTLHNLSGRIASLKVELTAGIPDQFTLIIEGEDRSLPCTVVWRLPKQMGVRFSAPGNEAVA